MSESYTTYEQSIQIFLSPALFHKSLPVLKSLLSAFLILTWNVPSERIRSLKN